MDRHSGYWWHPQSTGLLVTKTDESQIPFWRIDHHHHPNSSTTTTTNGPSNHTTTPSYEEHRYPFAGQDNPRVQLAYVRVDRPSILHNGSSSSSSSTSHSQPQQMARDNWTHGTWFDAPREASEYLARVHWIVTSNHDNHQNDTGNNGQDTVAVVTQWQNRAQSVSVLARLDLARGRTRTLLTERTPLWINLHQLFWPLPRAVRPDEGCHEIPSPPLPDPLPPGSFSFLYASEQRTGYQHLDLYTYVPGIHGEQAVWVRTLSSGEWMVEQICGVDMTNNVVYVTGTYDSVLERHLYALPLLNNTNGHHHRRWKHGPESPQSPHGNAMDESPPHGGGGGGGGGMRRSLTKVMNVLSGGKRRGGRGHSSSAATTMTATTPIRLTMEAGMHSIVMDESCELFVDTHSGLDRPLSTCVYALPNDIWEHPPGSSLRLVHTLFDAIHEDNSLSSGALLPMGQHPSPLEGLPKGATLLASLPPPELISFPTSDGSHTLFAAVYKPDPRIFGPGPYPLICSVYGGPNVQRVNNSWSQCADMRAQRLASMGFCVVKCDNRGSSRRGVAFESAIHRQLGRLEVLDQVAAVRQLTLRGVADASRVGVYGWSYGGYLACMCLARAPDVFQCGVAGAPVTSWDGYDTHYTERYMGLPAENAAGYHESAVYDHVPNIRGKLLIVHGLLDENVHFRHTTRLINKLVACSKDYELLLLPEERHSPRRFRDRIYMESKISDFFVRQLSPGMHTLNGHL